MVERPQIHFLLISSHIQYYRMAQKQTILGNYLVSTILVTLIFMGSNRSGAARTTLTYVSKIHFYVSKIQVGPFSDIETE